MSAVLPLSIIRSPLRVGSKPVGRVRPARLTGGDALRPLRQLHSMGPGRWDVRWSRSKLELLGMWFAQDPAVSELL